jgi:methionine-rich copper-binding protein CopC
MAEMIHVELRPAIASRIRTWAAIAALLALAWLAVEAALAARAVARAARAAEAVAAEIPQRVDLRAAEIIARADDRAASIERTAAARIASLERTADARLASLEERLDARLADAVAAADRRLGEATASVAHLVSQSTATMAAADGLLRRADGTLAAWHGAMYPWFDCGTGVIGEGRPCLQNELWWMTRKANLTLSSVTLAAETTSDTLRRYGPSTARSVDGIAASLDKMGRWYTSRKRLIVESGLLLGGLWWRSKGD